MENHMIKLIVKVFVLLTVVNFLLVGSVFYFFSKTTKIEEKPLVKQEVKIEKIEKTETKPKEEKKVVFKDQVPPLPPTPKPPVEERSIFGHRVEKKKPSIKWRGFEFSSVNEMKESPVFKQFIADKERDRLEKEEDAKVRDQVNLKIIKRWRGMSEVDIAREESLRKGQAIIDKK